MKKTTTTMLAGLALVMGMAGEASAQCSTSGNWVQYGSAQTISDAVSGVANGSGRLVCATRKSAITPTSDNTWHELHVNSGSTSGTIAEYHSNTTADPAEGQVGTWKISGSNSTNRKIVYTYTGGAGDGSYTLYGDSGVGAASTATQLSFCTGANGTEVALANVTNGPVSGNISTCSPP